MNGTYRNGPLHQKCYPAFFLVHHGCLRYYGRKVVRHFTSSFPPVGRHTFPNMHDQPCRMPTNGRGPRREALCATNTPILWPQALLADRREGNYVKMRAALQIRPNMAAVPDRLLPDYAKIVTNSEQRQAKLLLTSWTIQPGQRLATGPELNFAYKEVTNYAKPKEWRVIGHNESEGIQPRNCICRTGPRDLSPGSQYC